MNLLISPRRWALAILSLALTLASAAYGQDGDEAEPSLSILIQGEDVQVHASAGAMGEQELNLIRNYFTSQAKKYPFEGTAQVRIELREPVLGQLRQRLEKAQAHPDDQNEIEDAISEALTIAYRKQEREGENSEEKIFVGTQFLIGGDESYHRVVAIGANGSIGGEVNELILIGSKVELKPTARVKNAVISVGSDLKSAPQTQASSQKISVDFPDIDWSVGGHWEQFPDLLNSDAWRFFTPFATLVTFISAAILGLLYLVFFADFELATREQLGSRLGASLGWGILGYLGSMGVSIALIITIVGVLMLPFLGIFMMILLSMGYFSIATFIGSRILDPEAERPYASFFLGLFLLKIVELIPWVGGVIIFILTTAGFGAALAMLWRARRRRHIPMAA